MTEWREVRLGDLVEASGGYITTGPFGSQLHSYEYTADPSGVPVVMPRDMVEGRVDRASVSRVSEETAQRLDSHRLAPGDIVLARRGDVGRFAFIEIDEAGWLCGTGSMRVHAPDRSVIWPRFLRYAMASPEVGDWLIGQAVGATMPNLNGAIVGNVPLRVPDLQTQIEIASVLSALDELIEINERRIEILEGLARSLYREWFVRFRFPGHAQGSREPEQLPHGWSMVALREIATLRYGKSLPSRQRRPGACAVVSSAGIVGSHEEALVDAPGIVIGRKGNVGSVWWIDQPFFPIDTTFFVESEVPLGLLYWQLKDLAFINSHAAVPGLSREQATGLPIVKVDAALASRFDAFHQALFEMIKVLQEQNTRLLGIRDLLLPRLVTGRLDISDIDLGDLLPAEAA